MNRIWIELEKPQGEEHAKTQCVLVNNMLRKLVGGQALVDWHFFYMPGVGYCYGGDMGYETLLDNGKWLNLDRLGA